MNTIGNMYFCTCPIILTTNANVVFSLCDATISTTSSITGSYSTHLSFLKIISSFFVRIQIFLFLFVFTMCEIFAKGRYIDIDLDQIHYTYIMYLYITN